VVSQQQIQIKISRANENGKSKHQTKNGRVIDRK
jgi:hypothetical protein